MHNQSKLAVIGLSYVGLPLAVEFAKKYPVVGFDVKAQRIKELNSGHDVTREVADETLQEVVSSNKKAMINDYEAGLLVTDDIIHTQDCNFYIVTVPTPIDKHKTPDLGPLMKASETVGQVLNRDDVVIYESTVYPGATKEDCIPVLEEQSALKFNKDFYVGYSPERINPGDKEHTLVYDIKGALPKDKVDARL